MTGRRDSCQRVNMADPGSRVDEADRILRLLQDVTPTACAACLARAIGLPEPAVLDVAADLLAGGRLTERIAACPVCRRQTQVLQAKASPRKPPPPSPHL